METNCTVTAMSAKPPDKVGTSRCDVTARVQRAERKACEPRIAAPIRSGVSAERRRSSYDARGALLRLAITLLL